jgi:hypothetical protein
VSRAVFRFVKYDTALDPLGEVTYSAVCVSGEEADCAAASGDMYDQDAANKWMAEHTRDTGHNRFQRTCRDYAIVTRRDE